jgi:hypothetical protein
MAKKIGDCLPKQRQIFKIKPMIQTIEGIIDGNGLVKLPSGTRLPVGRRALITVLDENAQTDIPETALLGEDSLAEDWLRPEEEEAWEYLQTEQ